LLTLFWGFNWPVMKFGVAELPPLYFRTICLGGGLIVIWSWGRMMRVPMRVPAGAWPLVIKLAIPNLIIWHLLAIVAIKMLPSGRAAILGYTMPVWAVLIGVIAFSEKPPRRQWWGIAAATAGVLLLLSSEFTVLAGSPLGTVLMLTAAVAWGYGTHLMRRHLTDMPTLALTFWMLTLTVGVMFAVSVAFELDRWRAPTALEWTSIVYNILLAVAFCHVVWSMLARKLPPAASGLSVMMVPVLGVFSGMWLLDERPFWQDYAALTLIVIALATVFIQPKSAVR
jgi:drug/metabolite transporter (DMT)-like permease